MGKWRNGRRSRLKSGRGNSCGFKSHLPHQRIACVYRRFFTKRARRARRSATHGCSRGLVSRDRCDAGSARREAEARDGLARGFGTRHAAIEDRYVGNDGSLGGAGEVRRSGSLEYNRMPISRRNSGLSVYSDGAAQPKRKFTCHYELDERIDYELSELSWTLLRRIQSYLGA